MKLAEAKYNVVTQHICSQTAEKAISNRGAEMTLDNLVMKFNLKTGGVNHGLRPSLEFIRQNRIDSGMAYVLSFVLCFVGFALLVYYEMCILAACIIS